MMRLAVAAVGKLDKLLVPAASEYQKRLSRYATLELIETPLTPDPAKPSAALEAAVKVEEGERLLARLKPGDIVIALHPTGTRMDTPAFAKALSDWTLRERVVFLVGGSLGLSDAVLARADARLSLSDLTLPHGLARVMLLEQLFRACKILAGERYHK